MACEMCGKNDSKYKISVEDTLMEVCENCTSYGSIVKKPAKIKTSQPVRTAVEYDIIPDFAEKIRKSREESGLSQKDFAMKIRERESALRSFEAGTLKPTMTQAQKLKKILGIPLIKQVENTQLAPLKTNSGSLTLGDVVKIKNR